MNSRSYDRTIFFHVHVRKCGGSTFHSQILKRQFGDGYYRDASLIDYQYSPAQVTEIIENCGWLKAYSSHKVSLDLPYQHASTRVVAVAFVRDPIDRFLSQYAYLHRHPKAWDYEASQLSLADYVESLARGRRIESERQFSQLAQLTGQFADQGLRRLPDFLEHNDLILVPTELFDDACLYLERVYSGELGDCSYVARSNRSTEQLQVDDSVRQRLREQLGDEEFELHRLATERFQSQCEAIDLTGDTLDLARDEFRLRCKAAAKASASWISRLLAKRKK